MFISCSDRDLEQAIKQSQIENVSIKNSSAIDASVVNQFSNYLFSTDQYGNETDWDFTNMIEIFDQQKSIYCYMAKNKNNPKNILGGCTTKEGLITTFFTFENNEGLYTLKDEYNCPVVDVRPDLKNNQLLFLYNYDTEAQTRASYSEWCGVGMAIVGAAFAPATFGASIGFAACWGVVAALMCRT